MTTTALYDIIAASPRGSNPLQLIRLYNRPLAKAMTISGLTAERIAALIDADRFAPVQTPHARIVIVPAGEGLCRDAAYFLEAPEGE